ncbi:MAG: aminotransferase [Magnetovibrio sp.]|nr:aminotransferase [Magnetovibrio sp.]
MKPMNSTLSKYGVTVFEAMSRLALENNAINLGQGFPDENGPEELRQIAANAVIRGPNQYPPMLGIPELRQAVAAHNKRFYELDLNWETEIMVTSGATEAIASSLFGLLEPGDEVILIEPLYDCYLPLVERAGGIPKFVQLKAPQWELPQDQFSEAFSAKTKLIILNSPHNPGSKVFSRDELQFITDLVIKNNTYVVCDEVYEHLVFDDHKHIPLMTFPGMRDRCVKVGSAGKTFSMTAWKVGYISASENLLKAISKAHQFLTFTTPTFLQEAVAVGLSQNDIYFKNLRSIQQKKRDRLKHALDEIGFEVLKVEGTYFLSIDIRSVGFMGSDVDFCKDIIRKAGVAAIPISAFYQGEDSGSFARFCFSKKDHILDDATKLLGQYINS